MMKRGVWHQCGHHGQTIATELVQQGVGVGVVVSPCDVSLSCASKYAAQWRENGADVLLDEQFYLPAYSNKNLKTYRTESFRSTVHALHQRIAGDPHDMVGPLVEDNKRIGATAVLAPAVKYEADQPAIVELNRLMFKAARRAGDELGIPTIATVVIGRSAVTNDETLRRLLSRATSLQPDGWYFAFEFDGDDRVPASAAAVYRCCRSVLALASTGLPALHAYAGPMSLLSFGAGAHGAAVGAWQNLWRFDRARFQPRDGGGGGNAPCRMWSSSLWGTLVHEEETNVLRPELLQAVATETPYSPAPGWTIGPALRHMIYAQGRSLMDMLQGGVARQLAVTACQRLETAQSLYEQVCTDLRQRGGGQKLKDRADCYHGAWIEAMHKLLEEEDDTYTRMEFMA